MNMKNPIFRFAVLLVVAGTFCLLTKTRKASSTPPPAIPTPAPVPVVVAPRRWLAWLGLGLGIIAAVGGLLGGWYLHTVPVVPAHAVHVVACPTGEVNVGKAGTIVASKSTDAKSNAIVEVKTNEVGCQNLPFSTSVSNDAKVPTYKSYHGDQWISMPTLDHQRDDLIVVRSSSQEPLVLANRGIWSGYYPDIATISSGKNELLMWGVVIQKAEDGSQVMGYWYAHVAQGENGFSLTYLFGSKSNISFVLTNVVVLSQPHGALGQLN